MSARDTHPLELAAGVTAGIWWLLTSIVAFNVLFNPSGGAIAAMILALGIGLVFEGGRRGVRRVV